MADRYWVGDVVNGNIWNTTDGTKWATTSGGAGGASRPTTSDRAIFDANSPDCQWASGVAFFDLDCTGYSGTFTGSVNGFSFQSGGSITLSPTMTTPVNGFIGFSTCSVSYTFNTANKRIFGSAPTLSGNSTTKTFNGDLIWNGAGNLSITATSMSIIVNGDCVGFTVSGWTGSSGTFTCTGDFLRSASPVTASLNMSSSGGVVSIGGNFEASVLCTFGSNTSVTIGGTIIDLSPTAAVGASFTVSSTATLSTPNLTTVLSSGAFAISTSSAWAWPSTLTNVTIEGTLSMSASQNWDMTTADPNITAGAVSVPSGATISWGDGDMVIGQNGASGWPIAINSGATCNFNGSTWTLYDYDVGYRTFAPGTNQLPSLIEMRSSNGFGWIVESSISTGINMNIGDNVGFSIDVGATLTLTGTVNFNGVGGFFISGGRDTNPEAGVGGTASVSIGSGSYTLREYALRDTTFTGGATFAGIDCLDLGNNSGITLSQSSKQAFGCINV